MKTGDVVATQTDDPLIGLVLAVGEHDPLQGRMIWLIWSHTGTGKHYKIPAHLLEVICESR